MQLKKEAHVAVAAVWFERFLECSRTQGTSEFPSSVWRFYHSLVDLGKDELAIKTTLEKYLEDEWNPEYDAMYNEMMDNETSDTRGVKEDVKNRVEKVLILRLFNKIAQTIQNSGVGWPTKDEMQSYHLKQE